MRPVSAPSIILDRREKPRVRVSRKAFVSDAESRFYYYCFIRDATDKGCRLYSPDALDFPSPLWLYPDEFPAPLLGRVVWRHSNTAGIRFIKDMPPELTDIAVHRPAGAMTFAAIGERIQERAGLLRGTNRPTYEEDEPVEPIAPPLRGSSGFLATAAHALKTPLKSISVALSQFMAKALDKLPRQLRDLILIASRDTKRMERVVDDLLATGNVERGKIPIRRLPEDLVTVARDAVEADAEYTATHGVTCRLEAPEGPAMVRIDADRIRQVLSNLISNSAKSSSRGQEVVVRIERTDDAFRVSVIDHGAGIARSVQEELFERTGKPGLGLAICRSILHHHGSELSFTSELGRGSVFTFDLAGVEPDRVEI